LIDPISIKDTIDYSVATIVLAFLLGCLYSGSQTGEGSSVRLAVLADIELGAAEGSFFDDIVP
jgi:hypothetical protein